MIVRLRAQHLIACSMLFLAACSGQSGNQSARVVPISAATATPIAKSADAAVTLRVFVPSGTAAQFRGKRRAYVSPATNSLTFAQNGGAPQPTSLAANSPSCVAATAGRTCTANISASAGADQTFTLKLFASTDGSGTPLAVQTLVATIVAGHNNPLSVTLDGVVSAISIAFSNASLIFGTPGTTNVIVNALDASGNTIVGPGVFADANGNPVTISLADDDTTSSSVLGATTATGPATITLTYDGGSIANIAIAASAGSIATSAELPIVCGGSVGGPALFVGGGLSTGPGKNDVADGFVEVPLSGPSAAPRTVYGISSPVSDTRGYVYGAGGSGIEELCPNAVATAVPYRTYGLGTVISTAGLGVDGASHVFVLEDGPGSNSATQIAEYAADVGSVGTATAAPAPSPIALIQGPSTLLSDGSSLAADATGNIFVANGAQVLEYAHGSTGNVAPSRTITDTAAGLLDVVDVKADAAGNVYAVYQHDNIAELDPSNPLGGYAIVEYAHGSYTTPLRVISGPNTQLATYLGSTANYAPNYSVPPTVATIALDPSGNIYALNVLLSSNGSQTTAYNTVAKFTSDQNGNVAPAVTFAVTGTQDIAMAVNSSGQIAIADASGFGILLYGTTGTLLGQIPPASSVGLIEGVVYDASGNLFASSQEYFDSNFVEQGKNAILKFTAPVTSNSTPAIVPTLLGYQALGLDGSGSLYADNGGVVDVFAPGDTTGQPERSMAEPINYGAGAGLGVDSAGNTYGGYLNASFIDELPAGSGGFFITPNATYEDIAASTIDAVVAVDTAGNVYVGSCDTKSIAVFGPGQTEGPPIRQIVGKNTRLGCVTSLAADPTGNIYTFDATGYLFGPSANGDVAPSAGGPDVQGVKYLETLSVGPGAIAGGISTSALLGFHGPAAPAASIERKRQTCAVEAIKPHGGVPAGIQVVVPRPGFVRTGACLGIRTPKGSNRGRARSAT